MAKDLGSSKSLKIDELHQKGKAVTVGMEGWAMTQKSLHSTVDTHNDAITSLQKGLRMVEQQVKAMARVMANQNVDKIQQDRTDSMDSLQKELTLTLTEKLDEVHQRVNREVGEVLGKRAELVKRVNALEQKLTDLVIEKNDEQTVARNELQTSIDKVSHQFQILETEVMQENSKLKDLIGTKEKEYKIMGKRLQDLIESEAAARAKSLLEVTQESEKVNEVARSLISAALKDLKTHTDKSESKLLEHNATLRADLAKEVQERMEGVRSVSNQVHDLIALAKRETERLVAQKEEDTDRKVAAVARGMPEVRQALEAEKAQREASFLELSRRLAQERKDRDLDEDRLLGMISTCMASLDRIHRS